MSFGLVPSKSTVYISNIPFSLTNNDLHKMFEKFGRIVKVTVLKDKKTRESKGVAFIFFLDGSDAKKCISSVNKTSSHEINISCVPGFSNIGGRTVCAKMAKDNGRSQEFIRKRVYPDKSTCYECGEEGHLSYQCPSNTLGTRDPPPKKKKKPKKDKYFDGDDYIESSDEDFYSCVQNSNKITTNENESGEEVEPDLETLSAAIQLEQEKWKSSFDNAAERKQKKIHKSSYFSDEEEISD